MNSCEFVGEKLNRPTNLHESAPRVSSGPFQDCGDAQAPAAADAFQGAAGVAAFHFMDQGHRDPDAGGGGKTV